MPQPLLEAGDVQVFEDGSEATIARLEEEGRNLRRLLNEARREVATLTGSMTALRSTLSPLHRALQMIFGELEAVAGDNNSASAPASPTAGASPKWEFWKKRYPGRIAETIDLLLVQGEMNASQLHNALRCDPRTLAKAVIYPMNKAGLIDKNGGKFSLKQL